MNIELSPTAKIIAQIGVKTYREHFGLSATTAEVEKYVSEMNAAQIVTYNAIAEWHDGRLGPYGPDGDARWSGSEPG